MRARRRLRVRRRCNTRGKWIPDGLFGPFCAVVDRVAVGATVHGFWHRVRASAWRKPIVT